MYPYLRMIKEMLKTRRAAPMHPFDVHVSHHLCWPQDIDPWRELNNGRTLTLYDLGRIPMAARSGLHKIARAKGWGMAVAGASVRYRKRVKLFDRIEMRTKLVGWDHRFVYMDQSMWVRGECTSQALLRSAITQGQRGIVPPAEMALALGLEAESPALPQWVQAWIAADAERPWPPEN
ncbi:acyl-CoA thioesterase [Xinfangfangia sp. CPCC 101601]|uniref:Acyl-CoA thioesterase n=1 Tax=Pseudogemmobacter lacusdianii TaxID=3069608 RepID=A0ABU0VXL1_9RHOB|nr:acyl-CoA thioesterase [Xinfangfangia sp. CPCC 101601]MDQ2066500.1 acyl-CoA thioesterase [Xinfangfangia sp. CPCC 101601]